MKKSRRFLVPVLALGIFIGYAQQTARGADRPAAVMPASDDVEMVFVPAGEFSMGSDDAEADDDEKPVSNVFVQDLSSFVQIL